MLGETLSHYRILEPLGRGGMAAVYVAEDTKLGRKVALKILDPERAESVGRRKRFEREAKAVAALNHPNIVTLYSVEEADGVHFITMELVRGKNLRELLPKRGFGLRRFFEIAIPLADAVAAAHEAGITHRDLKSDNVMMTYEGQVKVLDFGLAKIQRSPWSERPFNEWLTETDTQEGALVGTLAYMSPEQAEGRRVDFRTDIFSLGVVLYEMLTGRRPFAGETPSSVLSSILKDSPRPIRESNQEVPRELAKIVQWCLTKDPSRRMQSALDVRNALDGIRGDLESGQLRPTERFPARRWRVALVLTAALVAALVLWAVTSLRSPTDGPVTHFVIGDPPPVLTEGHAGLDLSPGGRSLVYVTERAGATELVLRRMDRAEPRILPGTEDAVSPFFSPDGEWIGYWDRETSRLKKISVRGGMRAFISPGSLPYVGGASWSADGTIFFSAPVGANLGIWRIPADGGEARPVTVPDPDIGERHYFPELLPGGKALLFTLMDYRTDSFDEASIVVVSLESGEKRVVIEGGTYPKYVPSGHLLYVQAGTIFAAPFDLDRREVVGPPVPVLEGVATQEAADFNLSRSGTVSYIPGTSPAHRRRLVWVSREGEATPLAVESNSSTASVSLPEDGFVAFHITDSGKIWIHDVARGTISKLTQQWSNLFPVWTPDGKRIVFMSGRGSQYNLWWQSLHGTDGASPLLPSEHMQFPTSVSPDGRALAFVEVHPETGSDLWFLPLEEERSPIPFVRTPAQEGSRPVLTRRTLASLCLR